MDASTRAEIFRETKGRTKNKGKEKGEKTRTRQRGRISTCKSPGKKFPGKSGIEREIKGLNRSGKQRRYSKRRH